MKDTPITEQLYDYIVETFAQEDDLLKRMPAEAEAKGIPLINISPEQGKFLQVLMARPARRKSLKSARCLATARSGWRALHKGGKLITVELNPLHAQTTRENITHAGLTDRVEVRQGDARKILPQLMDEAPFDLAFIDAEKAEYLDYVDESLKLVRKGGLIIGDNASARGLVWNAEPPENDRGFVMPIRTFNQRMATDPRLTSVLVPISDGMCVGVVK
jgi:caffeoyl-CoA O-methyltransferase